MSWDLLLGTGLTLLLVAQFALILWNRRELRRPASRTLGRDAPMVSLLVPARNEEAAIARCLAALATQDYPNLEVVVLDDASSDATADIAGSFENVKVVDGAPLPDGWTGKNWACDQLSRLARGDLLCFVDADTALAPGAVAAAVDVLEEHGAGLVSLLPRSGSSSFTGAVLLPMVGHAPYALFPMRAVHDSPNPMFAGAFGPFILVSRQAYRASGGHAAAQRHVVDDVQLSRNVKAAGLKIRLANGTDLVETAWYEGLGEIWRGFSKNAYGALGYRPWLGMAVVFVAMPLLLTPFARVGMGAIGGGIPGVAMWQSLIAVGNRAYTNHLTRERVWTAVLHPVAILFWGATLARSMALAAGQRSVEWKDRTVPIYPV